MDYNKAKQFFWMFKDIENAHQANGFTSIRHREKDELVALRFYMAERGCLAELGKYHQWWEVDLTNDSVVKAKIITSGFINEKSIIRRPGKVYVPAWDEEWALKEAKRMQQTFQFIGRIAEIEPIASGTSPRGTAWKRRTFAAEETCQNPNLAAFSILGDKCETIALRVGQLVKIDFQLTSRKHNDRYFTEAKVISVTNQE